MLLSVHLISTSIMVGAIWVIQLVHYPSFYYVSKEKYIKFQNFHMNRISFIVIPVMMAELFSGIMILYRGLRNDSMFIISIGCLTLIWLSTAILFTGIHQKLTNGYNSSLIDQLVNRNWLRTFLWTSRLILLVV